MAVVKETGIGTRILVALAANAIALLVAAIVLPRMSIDWPWFPVLVVVFTVISLIVTWVVNAVVQRKAAAAASLVGLASTWLTLLITDLVSDSLQIEGVITWVVATLIVWLATVVLQVAGMARYGRPRREARA